MNILFLCTGNSCRSILAEATFNHLAPASWKALSAGSKPTATVHPRSLALLNREGISTEGYHSKSWDNLPLTPDVVITVCSNAAGETCPAYLGQVVRSHWGVEDPAHATGTDAEIDAAFMSAYRICCPYRSLPRAAAFRPEEGPFEIEGGNGPNWHTFAERSFNS